jgi:hypothetical protein
MTHLVQVQEKLQETIANIRKMESALVEHPESPSLRANIRSLQKLQRNYEIEWLDAADERGMDVCSYRLFSEVGNPNVAAFALALGDFQNMFSVIYDALRGGPKTRNRVSADIERVTSFNFGYTYPGSVGIVFTLPNERLLPGIGTKLDETFATIFDLAQTDEPKAIAQYAKQLGPAPIQAAYKWAKDHSDSRIGADIEWRRNQDVRSGVRLQAPQLQRLKETIDVVSEESTEEIVVSGVLAAVNTISRTFHIVVPAFDASIKGRYTDAVSDAQRVTLPKVYTAYLKKTTRFDYSSGDQKTTYFLEKLEEPS